uniref:Choline/carnitine acyltransferase domain-containing protein n=1 Tax=Paramoeba aestuarina TaxID=180227 RepID=A0A7S4NT03_9EUKA
MPVETGMDDFVKEKNDLEAATGVLAFMIQNSQELLKPKGHLRSAFACGFHDPGLETSGERDGKLTELIFLTKMEDEGQILTWGLSFCYTAPEALLQSSFTYYLDSSRNYLPPPPLPVSPKLRLSNASKLGPQQHQQQHPQQHHTMSLGGLEKGVLVGKELVCGQVPAQENEFNKDKDNKEKIPSLPVPDLQHTLLKYLMSVKPLVSEQEFSHTVQCVSAFEREGGAELHKMLVERAKERKGTSWLREWWDDLVYMRARHNVTIMDSYFYNFGLTPPSPTFPNDIFGGRVFSPLIKRAATSIMASLDFKFQYNTGILPQEKAGKRAQCVQMYTRLFNGSRIPRKDVDYFYSYSGPLAATNHIFVICNDHFYFLDVTTPTTSSFSSIPLAQLAHQLELIYQDATSKPTGIPVGALSCQVREKWCEDRELLLSNNHNADLVEGIQSAAFGVCLDTVSPLNMDDYDARVWHNNGRGRWFDKPIQLIIFENGALGLHGEHSGMDGTVSKALVEHIRKIEDNKMQGMKIPIEDRAGKRWVPCSFDISPSVSKQIENALEGVKEEVLKVSHQALIFDTFGGSAIKKMKCSPDAFCQMAIQLAFYRIFQHLPAHYESASTRGFLHGRTETIRVSSLESKKFVEAVCSGPNSLTASKNEHLLRDALAKQSKTTRDCTNGLGVDRHLLGMKLLHLEKNPSAPLPSLYTDPSFSYSNTWRMSTSQLGGKYFQAGYGAVVDDGLGVSYSYTNNYIQFKTSARQTTPCSPTRFNAALIRSLQDMRTILSGPKAKL